MLISVIVNSLVVGCVYGAIGVGYSIIYKASGILSLAQGDMLMIGAFMGLTFYKICGIPIILSLLMVIVFMFFFGMAIERYMVSPLLKKGSSLAYIMLLTLALAMLLQNAAMLIWGSIVQQFPGFFAVRSIKIAGVGVEPEKILVVGLGVVIMVVLQLFLNKAKFGTAMRAAALDEKAASAVGINVPVTKGVTWGIAAAIAGVIGCILGPIYGVIYTMGGKWGQKAFAGAVVGGYGNMYGAIVGGMILGVVETLVTAYISSTFKEFIAFAVLIVVLIVMPNGIFRAKILE